jgi:hypothetical protein
VATHYVRLTAAVNAVERCVTAASVQLAQEGAKEAEEAGDPSLSWGGVKTIKEREVSIHISL